MTEDELFKIVAGPPIVSLRNVGGVVVSSKAKNVIERVVFATSKKLT